MSDMQQKLPREYFERWKRVGPELEKIRRRELQTYDFKKNQRAIASLFQLGTDRRKRRKSSGLVEWYRRLGLGR